VKALKELLDGDWLILTRQGGRHRCSLYGLTFYKLDACEKQYLDPPFGKDEPTPRGGWFKEAPGQQPANRPAKVIGEIRRCTTGVSIHGLRAESKNWKSARHPTSKSYLSVADRETARRWFRQEIGGWQSTA
jgi:hypothetical protein